ncbi:hypothetical protein T265_09266 [Opisthorchis viverrini]|uniref:Uncharacterized protein n=1 Tax=Opisthorchis viverrini TaxID=6198 RepID=A0A074ZHJ2_OPIVI|nr:hypothetical protein T265_09266 [Opisthorchis viverrini]KER22705.1 hypothetical protein T265_09266 [Opisthorchis viverrini]
MYSASYNPRDLSFRIAARSNLIANAVLQLVNIELATAQEKSEHPVMKAHYLTAAEPFSAARGFLNTKCETFCSTVEATTKQFDLIHAELGPVPRQTSSEVQQTKPRGQENTLQPVP